MIVHNKDSLRHIVKEWSLGIDFNQYRLNEDDLIDPDKLIATVADDFIVLLRQHYDFEWGDDINDTCVTDEDFWSLFERYEKE